jgi:hypothetical protein
MPAYRAPARREHTVTGTLIELPTGVRPPSLFLRAATALFLLLLFFAIVLGIAAFLTWLPFVFFQAGRFNHTSLIFALVCWTIAAVLVGGAVGTRPPPFRPTGRELRPEEAPRLFEMLGTLAATSGTRPLPACTSAGCRVSP